MGLQYVLSIFGRTLSDRLLSAVWRMTDNPEVTGWGVHLKAKEFRLELAHAGFPV